MEFSRNKAQNLLTSSKKCGSSPFFNLFCTINFYKIIKSVAPFFEEIDF